MHDLATEVERLAKLERLMSRFDRRLNLTNQIEIEAEALAACGYAAREKAVAIIGDGLREELRRGRVHVAKRLTAEIAP